MFALFSWQTLHVIHHLDLKMQEDLRNSLVLLGVTPLWHVAQWVSHAPPHISFNTSPDPAFIPKINSVPRDPEVSRIFRLLDPYLQRFFQDFSNPDSRLIPISGIFSNLAKNEEFRKFGTMKNFFLGPPLVRRSKDSAEEFLLLISCFLKEFKYYVFSIFMK